MPRRPGFGRPPTLRSTDAHPDLRHRHRTRTDADLVNEVGADIQVTIDRWSVGQIGWSEVDRRGHPCSFWPAVVAWMIRRLVGRWTKDWDGPAAAARRCSARSLSLGLYLFAAVIALEILGFSLGPVLIIIVLIILVFLFMQPDRAEPQSAVSCSSSAARSSPATWWRPATSPGSSTR